MQGKSVLVADDDPLIRDLLRIRLQAAGCNVIPARDGMEALNVLASSVRVDGVILDVNMPKLDGFGVLEALRATGRPAPPILMLTARHAAHDVLRALELGAKDYLSKPFTEHQLAARLHRLLRRPPAAPA